MNTEQQRYERFAELRAIYQEDTFDEIMERIYEEEIDAATRAHDEMLDSMGVGL